MSIIKIPIARHHSHDKIIWAPDDHGIFSVKSCYRVLNEELSVHDKEDWAVVWKLNIPPKVKVFFWQACSNCLPTRDLLIQRRVDCESVCPICNVEKESLWHIFVACAFMKEIWRQMSIQPQTPLLCNSSRQMSIASILPDLVSTHHTRDA